MALRQIVLASRIQQRQDHMQSLVSLRDELRARREALAQREEELAQAVNEVTGETPQEDRDALDAQVNQWEQDDEALRTEETENENAISQTQAEIDGMQQELDEINARGTAKPVKPEQKPEERKERTTMSKYNTRRLWFGMEHQERDAFIAREEIKDFAQRVRALMGSEQRAVGNAQLTVPDTLLPLIRTVAAENSKLLKHVNVQRVPGTSRQNVAGLIPEAVWTEMCAKINEVDWSFGQVELEGYKVAAGIYLCNALKEDSDLDLITEILSMLGKAVGVAVDKAILYGKGTKMPMGIVTRLAQTAEPEDYSATAPAWKNLSESHMLAVSGKTDATLFKAIVEATAAIDSDYATGSTFWAMNHKTRIKLVSNALTINAAGAIVAGVENTMPVIGGAIEELNFVPDDVIIGGYGDMYVMAERAGLTLGYSEHYRFMEDQTAFKATARYDGEPVIPAAFVAIGINGVKPTADAVSFAADTANQA